MHERVQAMDTPVARLGGLVRERREAMGIYTVVDAARRSGLSRETWAKVERGEPAAPVTYRKIEDLLNWMPGSCGSVLAGGEPHGELLTVASHAPADDSPYSDPAEREIWKLTELPESERLLYIQLLRERRRAAG